MPIEINTDTIAEAIASRLMDSNVLIPRLLTLDQAAKYLGLTKEALKAKVHHGRIPTVDLDKKLRFDRLDLDRMIEQNKRSRIGWRERRKILGQGSIYLRNGWWWCDFTAGGVRRRESCETKDRDEALAYLQRRQGKLASGEFLAPDRVRVRDLLNLLLEDYEVRSVSQAYIAGLKVKSILTPRLGDIKACKLTTAQVKAYIQHRLKKVKPGTVNRELGMLHRAFQLGYQQDPPLVARVPYFPKLPEGEPRKGFLKPELTGISCSPCRRNSGCFLSLLITLAYGRAHF